MQITVAVVQFEIIPLAAEENLVKAERFIQEAVRQQAQMIVFPEDFLLGPLNGRVGLADFEKRYVTRLQQLAIKYNVDIVPGSITEGDETGLYNTTYYIDSSGKILGHYRKVNLWLSERSYVKPGNSFTVCQTRFGKVGLVICWDLAFPEIFRAMVQAGAEIVICPSYWCFEDAGIGQQHATNAEITFVDALCVARAFEQNIILVYANAAGRLITGNNHDTLIGHSQITAPFKGTLHICDHQRETMFIQTIDTAILADAETAYEIRRDLKRGLWLDAFAQAETGLE
jgi:predicted amidohydrolase